MTDGLKDNHRNAIIDILSTNKRIERVVLFGSRAMGTYTMTSDVDLVLYGDHLTLTDQAHLADALDKLTVPQRVDLVLHNVIDNDELCKHIERHGIEWYRRQRDMGLTDAIDITDDQRKVVYALIERHLPNTTTWVYGSRAKWTARPQSDLDMVIFATPEQNSQVFGLREAFEESNLPFRVDLFVWDDVPERFRKHIKQDYVVLVEDEERSVRNGWHTATVEEIAEKVAMGPFGSSIKVETFVPKGVPIISGQHLHGSRIDDGPGFNFISHEHAQRLANANVIRGDIVLTHRGTIGQVAYIPEHSQFDRYVVSQSQFYMRCNKSKAIPEFVTMYFRSPEGQHQLLANTSQVGVPSIAQPGTYLRTIEIPLPPLSEQRTIAHILGTLDDNIELNRRMDETLEEMARALFKSWFVDFDPVRAKMEGRDTGLPPDVADLFPDRLVESELGEIPERWEVKALGELIELAYGKALKADDRKSGSIPVYGSNGQVGWHDKKLAAGPGIVVGRKGNPGIVTWAHSDFFPIDTTFYVVPRDTDGDLPFLFFALIAQNLPSVAADSAVPGLNRNLAYMNRQLVPDKQVIDEFNHYASEIFTRRHHLEEESRTLAVLRDTLLPKLVSGELRVAHKFHNPTYI